MILPGTAGWLFGVVLAAVAPPNSAAPLGLRLRDDQGAQIRESLKVCLHRELETFCLEQPPYKVPSTMRDFDSITVEGPSHGPIEVNRGTLAPVDTGELLIRVPRKGSVDIQGLLSDAVALSLYPVDDTMFRRPAFRFEHLQPTGLRLPARRFVVTLSDGQHAPDLQLLDIKPGAKYTLMYHQRPGWSLLFRSLGAENTRVKDADAVLVSAAVPGKERELAKTTTDDQGLGVLTGVTEPFATLAVSGAGYLKTSAAGLTAGRGSFAFREVVLERGGNVRATVSLDGVPAAGAVCQLASTQRKKSQSATSHLPTAEVLAEMRVSPTGICETPRFPHGQYVFRVIPKDAHNSNDEVVMVPNDQTVELEMRLRRFSVSGEVHRAGKPAPGAIIVITNQEDFPEFGRSAPPEPLKLETDEEGRYRGTVWRKGTYMFTVASKELVAGASKDEYVGENGATVDFDMNESDISGVVVDQKQQPVEGAFINLAQPVSGGVDNRWAWSDQDGKFTFPLSGGGHIELTADKIGYHKSDSIGLDVVPDAEVPPQTIVLQRLDRIEGHVLWPNGAGAPNMGVTSYQSDPKAVPMNAGSALTEPDGHFSVSKALSPTTRVFVTGAGCPLQVADVPDTGEDVQLPCAPLSSGLEITMTKDDGAAAQDERVFLRWNGILIPRKVLISHQGMLGMSDGTDGSGRLTIVDLPPGTYDVFLQSGSSEATISEGLQYGFISTVTLNPMETTELEVKLQPSTPPHLDHATGR